MSLSNYVVPSRTVLIGEGQSVQLTGLSLESIAVLVREHQDCLEDVFAIFQQVADATPAQMGAMAASVASRAPGLLANIVALSANEPEAAPSVMRMALPLQIELLMEVGGITFVEPGSVKKTMGMIMSLLSMTASEKTAPGKKTTPKRAPRK